MDKKHTYLIILFLIIVCIFAFGRIAGNDFVNFDDNKYITANYHVKSGLNPATITWAFTSVVAGNWHPLTMLSHLLDWSIFGAHPAGSHLINLLLHIGAVIFLFLFLYKTTNQIWLSAFAAAFFALHPLRVESVAWAAERKDVLSLFFGMACLYAYAFYAEHSKLSGYILCLILFVLSLLSKPMLVTLPFVLLLLDYWPLNRFQNLPVKAEIPTAPIEKTKKKKGKKHQVEAVPEKKISVPLKSNTQTVYSLLWEKVPFFLLTIVFSMIAVWAQKKDESIITLDQLPFTECLKNALVSYVSYLGKIFWPVNLAVYYPFDFALPAWKVFISVIILAGITFAVLYYMKKMPFLLVGWFWYLGTLVPVIGLVKVGNQALADRYTYLPSIGIAIMLLWSIPFLFPGENTRKKILFPAGMGLLIILGVLTWHQCGYWKNSLQLFDHALQVTNNNVVAITNRGEAYFNLGQYQEAIDDYNNILRLKSDNVMAYNNRGNAYAKLSQFQQAINDFNEAIRLKPDYADAYNNMGNTYLTLGRYQQAVEQYNQAIHLNPDDANAHTNRGISYLSQGNKEMGCQDAQKACELSACQLLEMTRKEGDCP